MTEQEWLKSQDPWPMFQFLTRWEHRPEWGFISRVTNWVRSRFRPVRLSPRLLYLSVCGLKRVQGYRLERFVLRDNEVFGPGLLIEEQFADGEIRLEQLLADDARRQWHWPDPWHLV